MVEICKYHLVLTPTLRTKTLKKENTEAIAKGLDMVDELHEATAIRMTSYQQRMTNLYNRDVKLRAFQAEDLVLRRVFENTADPAAAKFQLNWKGQYTIFKVGPVGSYTLDKLDGTPMPKMWNAMHLKRYYQYKISLKVLLIKFPLKRFLPILGILSLKFSLKVLSIKFLLKCFLLILGILPISKSRCGS